MNFNPEDFELEKLVKGYHSEGAKVPGSKGRDAIQSWMIDAFPELDCTIHTRMRAGAYFDAVLLAKPELDFEVYQIVAVLCLVIAVKYDKNISVSHSEICRVFENKYSTELIGYLELYILKALEWKLEVLTPASVIRVLINAICKEGDYSLIEAKADLFAVVALISAELAKAGPVKIAIAATSLSIQLLGFKDFAKDWHSKILTIFGADKKELDSLESKIFDLTSA